MFMTWKGTKSELVTFIKELNEKHKTIKFDFQILSKILHYLTQCKTKITTSKQVYNVSLQMGKDSHTLSQTNQDL